jgi:hypothetical protein
MGSDSNFGILNLARTLSSSDGLKTSTFSLNHQAVFFLWHQPQGLFCNTLDGSL